MNNALRLQYLQAMGIEVWQLKQTPGIITEATPVTLEPPSSSSSPEEPNDHTATPPPKALPHSHTNIDWLLITDSPHLQPEAQLLLNEMRHALKLNQTQSSIVSVFKNPPPQAQTPHDDELAECRLLLEQHITRLQPKIILLFGAMAARCLLQTDAPLLELRGCIHKFAAISTIVTYHPQFLLHTPLAKRNAWLDLQLAMTAYQEVISL